MPHFPGVPIQDKSSFVEGVASAMQKSGNSQKDAGGDD